MEAVEKLAISYTLLINEEFALKKSTRWAER
jgi:hypothetical protein